MAKFTFLLRQTSKASTEQSITIRMSHKGSNFAKATGVSLNPIYFDTKTGKVSTKHPKAPEYNETISLLYNRIDRLRAVLVKQGIEPTNETMSKAWEAEDEELREKARIRANTKEILLEAQPGTDRANMMYYQLLLKQQAKLVEQLADKKKEIQLYELEFGYNDGRLLSVYIKRYADEMEQTAATNTTRIYRNLQKVVEAYDQQWRADEVNKATLAKFETWLIECGKKNLTIKDAITKVKTVVYHYADILGIKPEELTSLRIHKTRVKKKRNPNVIFLTKDELQDLINIELTNLVEQRVRDRFVLMSLLGIRWSDSTISAADIQDGHLRITTEKTDTEVVVPISPQAMEILTRYNFVIPAYQSQYFNIVIKKVCARIPSLNRPVWYKEYRGANKADKTEKPKYKAISAHVARKTFINLALLKGMNPVALAGIVGHEGTDLIMSTYGSKDVGKEIVLNLLD
jgi:integrase